MKKENTKEVKGAYEELKGVLSSIENKDSWFDDNGFADHANRVITRVGSLCSEITDIESYKIRPEYIQQRGNIIEPIPTKAKLKSLIGRIKGIYELEESSANTGHTFIQTQQQQMNIELLLDVRGQIDKHLQDYSKDQPERKFLEEVKSKLSTVKSAIDVLRLIISTAKEYGVSLATLLKIFGM